MEKEKDVSYIVFEGEMARGERRERRLWIALVAVIVAFFLYVAIDEIIDGQYDTYTYEYSQDGEGLNNINTGKQGDVLYGAEIESEG